MYAQGLYQGNHHLASFLRPSQSYHPFLSQISNIDSKLNYHIPIVIDIVGKKVEGN